MRLIKLTDSEGYTQNKTHWQVGTTHTASGKGTELCTDGVIHAYTSELLATLMNPAHGQFVNPQCFEAEGEVIVSDGTKVGCKSLTIVGIAELPKVTTIQRIAFSILCAKELCNNSSWNAWADEWLSGKDRSKKSAAAAVDATASYAYSATAYATYAAANTTAYAAYAATYATNYVATYAANATANAAIYAVIKIDFQTLAEKALTYA
jgi:hypothetical protein